MQILWLLWIKISGHGVKESIIKHLGVLLGAQKFENHCSVAGGDMDPREQSDKTQNNLIKHRNKLPCKVELFFLWDDLLQMGSLFSVQ